MLEPDIQTTPFVKVAENFPKVHGQHRDEQLPWIHFEKERSTFWVGQEITSTNLKYKKQQGSKAGHVDASEIHNGM